MTAPDNYLQRPTLPLSPETLLSDLTHAGLLQRIEEVATIEKSPVGPIDPFLCLHYNIHIEKIAASLDRCFALRDEWDRLRSEGALLFIELNEQFKQYSISHQEIEGNLWDLAEHDATNTEKSLKQYGDRLKETLTALDRKQAYYNAGAINDQKEFRVSRVLNSIHPYYISNQVSHETWLAYGANGAKQDKEYWVARDERISAERDLTIEDSNFKSEYARTLGEYERNKELLKTASERALQAPKEKHFRIARLELSHETSKRKLALANNEEGPLCYRVRANRIKDRIDLDYKSAIKYTIALGIGLTEIFGFVPTCKPPSEESSIDELYRYVHEAIEFLNDISSREVNTTVRISLRKKLGDKFGELLKGKEEKIEIRTSDLPGLSSLMISGISFVAVGADMPTCEVDVRTPAVSEYTRPDGTTGKINGLGPLDLRQAGCFRDEAGRTWDMLGAPMVTNLSPVGLWIVKIVGADKAVPSELYLQLRIRGFSLR
jgi:hypothetical protein